MEDTFLRDYSRGSGSTTDLAGLTEADLDDNHSLKQMLTLIGAQKRVVDFGCATGYLAQLLNRSGCQVVGIDINPEAAQIAQVHCEAVHVVDLDFTHLPAIFPEDKFDVAVFGNVLEHLRDPVRVLKAVQQILKPDGYVVASVPNIAHGAIRLAMLQGRLEYTKLGKLENAHLRFFTRKTLEELFEQTGYTVHNLERTTHPIFFDPPSGSEPLVPYIDSRSLTPELIRQIEQQEEATTFQFIVRAFPHSNESKYTLLLTKYNAAVGERQELRNQLQTVRAELEQQKLKYNQDVNSLQAQLVESQTELAKLKSALQASQAQLELTRMDLARTRDAMYSVTTSNFWRLRELWLRFKQTVLRG